MPTWVRGSAASVERTTITRPSTGWALRSFGKETENCGAAETRTGLRAKQRNANRVSIMDGSFEKREDNTGEQEEKGTARRGGPSPEQAGVCFKRRREKGRPSVQPEEGLHAARQLRDALGLGHHGVDTDVFGPFGSHIEHGKEDDRNL